MGGWGSGRQGGRVTIEDCSSCRLGISELRSLLRAPDGGSRLLLYQADGLLPLTVSLPTHHGHLRLQHASRAYDHGHGVDYTIGLTWTKVGFGGRRWWFLCPISGRRCSVLYLPRGASRFGSAKGHRLVHGVTRLAEPDRLWHRMRKIAHRLGDDDPDQDIPPDRPKWMRIATYDRLIDAWHKTAERRDDLCFTMAAGSLARCSGEFGG